jgi:hypothetical protein
VADLPSLQDRTLRLLQRPPQTGAQLLAAAPDQRVDRFSVQAGTSERAVAAINRDLQVRVITAILAGGAYTFLDIYKRVCAALVAEFVTMCGISRSRFMVFSNHPKALALDVEQTN